MQDLDEATLWNILETSIVGRLAVHDHSIQQTELTPIFFATDRQRIYFATQPGRKLRLLRQYPAGVGLQCEQESSQSYISVFVSGRYRDVQPGTEYIKATALLARKYRGRFIQQLGNQAYQAWQQGPRAIVQLLHTATTGCIDLEHLRGNMWNDARP